MNGEYPFCETDSFMDDLKSVAFDVLLHNPGSDFNDWQQTLINEYTDTITDALGHDTEEVYAELADLWESEYEDSKTGIFMNFSEWASAFATDEAVMIYEELVHERRKYKNEA